MKFFATAALSLLSWLPAALFSAPTPTPREGDDPFSANAFRVERDNLTEDSPAAPTPQSPAPQNNLRPRKVAAADWRPAAGTGLDNTPAPPRFLPYDNSVLLNDNWEYLEEDFEMPNEAMRAKNWTPVSLPHSWNAVDSIKRYDYRRDASWYRKTIVFTQKDLEGQQVLHFGGVGQSAEVWFNGQILGAHNGGYCAFNFPLNRHSKLGENTLLVRVSNERNRKLPPLSGDFNQYGGIYREVRLLRAPRDGFRRTDPLPKIRSETTAEHARFELEIPASVRSRENSLIEITATDPDGKVVSRKQVSTFHSANNQLPPSRSGNIPKPRLWAPETPNLYTFTLTLRDTTTNALIDTVRLRHGFRWFKFTPDDGFSLNGTPYRLRGINRHQDRPGFANALSDAQHDADLRRIKEAGFNFLRLAHYQQDDYVLQRCDELGLLVWEEIPLVNVIAPHDSPPNQTLAINAEHMLRSMITQHHRHPSIIIWGLGNEISFSLPTESQAHHTFEKNLLTHLNKIAHELDASRPTILVSHDSDRPIETGMMRIPDLVGYNLYKGWYRDNFDALTARLNALHAANPGKPLLLSEYGGGADPERHSEAPRRYDFSQEYAVDLLANYHDQFDAPPLRWLAGTLLWVLADFGAAHRVESHPYINNKGILDTDRRPKDSFYYLKARQQKIDPVVYIQSPTWLLRGGNAAKEYRVFSNMTTVTLTHNGRPVALRQPVPSTPAVFHFPVTLTPGKNTLRAAGQNATGLTKTHEITVHYDPTRPPEILPVVPKSVAPPPKKKTRGN